MKKKKQEYVWCRLFDYDYHQFSRCGRTTTATLQQQQYKVRRIEWKAEKNARKIFTYIHMRTISLRNIMVKFVGVIEYKQDNVINVSLFLCVSLAIAWKRLFRLIFIQ